MYNNGDITKLLWTDKKQYLNVDYLVSESERVIGERRNHFQKQYD